MPKYEVVKPFRGPDGNDLAAGDPVELTARQAKYLKLAGKVKEPASAKARAGKPAAEKKPETPASAKAPAGKKEK